VGPEGSAPLAADDPFRQMCGGGGGTAHDLGIEVLVVHIRIEQLAQPAQGRSRRRREARSSQPATGNERIRAHPSAGSMAGMGAGRHGTSTRLLAEWLHSSWLRYDRCEADVRHTAAVGLGQLAHVDDIVRHTEEIDRPQALNEVLRSLPARNGSR
jgi:hypothetical protein